MKNKENRSLLNLFIIFLKIGLFTFGGGYAMIPLIQREISENKKWITNEEILEIVAIAESTPGPIAVNTATFVGYKVSGFLGAFLSTVGVVLPSFLIITAISYILKEFQNITIVKYAFFGIRAGVLALIFKALWSMYKQCQKNIISYIIAAFALIAVSVFNVSALLVIIICALIGLIYSIIAKRRNTP